MIKISLCVALVVCAWTGNAYADKPTKEQIENLCVSTQKAAIAAQNLRQKGYSKQQVLSIAGDHQLTQTMISFVYTQSKTAKPESIGRVVYEMCRANAD
jgi:hypothetical protein